MSKLILGLTSGIAGGKDTAASIFTQYGIETVNADAVSHRLTSCGAPLAEKIIEYFGEEYRQEDGSINRRKLRKRVFSVAKDRQWLEALLHPPIQEELKRMLSQCQSPYSLLVSPLILETSQAALCDKVIVIKIEFEVQIMRASKRDKMNRKEVEAIIATQMPIEQKIKQADYILDNNGTQEDLARQIVELNNQLMLLIRTTKSRSS